MTLLLASLLLQGAEDYFPLKPGVVWKYKESARTERLKGNIMIGLAMIQKELVKDVECCVLESNGEAYFPFQKLWIAADSEGIKMHKVRVGGMDYVLDAPQPFIKNGLKKGLRWEGVTPGGKYECFVESEDEAHLVYIGKFPKVRRLSMKFGDLTAVVWLQRGLGPIRFKSVWDFKETNEKIEREVELSDGDNLPGIEWIWECDKCKKTSDRPSQCCQEDRIKVPKDKAMRDALAGHVITEKLNRRKHTKVKYDFTDGGKRGGATTLREAVNMLLGAAKIPWEIDPKITNADQHLLNGKGETDTIGECLDQAILKPLGYSMEIRHGKVVITK